MDTEEVEGERKKARGVDRGGKNINEKLPYNRL